MSQDKTLRCARHDSRPILILLLVSAVIRGFLAGWIELGTDEAYYWTYAQYPDWSHFDHPGMVGWVIQLFSLNLLFDSEFFLRLASVVFMTINTWIMYRIGRELKDEATGLWAALLYTASIYAFIVTGIFILPDTPLSLFWLLAFWMFIKYLKQHENKHLLIAGLLIGLGALSKYTAAFLWFGFMLYILCFDRKQFRNPCLYLSLLITALCCLPVVIWNIQNDFVSFRFHGDRVGLFGPFKIKNFGTELAGEFFYNNPVCFIAAILATIAAFRHKLPIGEALQRLILTTTLPMIGLFLFFSLTRQTLPHWSGPAYNLLILLSATWLSSLEIKKAKGIVISALSLLVLILVVGVTEIKTGFVTLDHHTEETELGKDDLTLDVYGWRQAYTGFKKIREHQIAEGIMKEEDAIIGHNWFPTANFHYYIARPLGMEVMGYGSLENIHKYLWINDKTAGYEKNANYWYLADSHYFIDPHKVFAYTNFKHVEQVGVIPIKRNGKVVRNIFVYECKGLVYIPKTLQKQS
jgi:hypothetical protein